MTKKRQLAAMEGKHHDKMPRYSRKRDGSLFAEAEALMGSLSEETRQALYVDQMLTGSFTICHRKDGTVERVSPERFFAHPNQQDKGS